MDVLAGQVTCVGNVGKREREIPLDTCLKWLQSTLQQRFDGPCALTKHFWTDERVLCRMFYDFLLLVSGLILSQNFMMKYFLIITDCLVTSRIENKNPFPCPSHGTGNKSVPISLYRM